MSCVLLCPPAVAFHFAEVAQVPKRPFALEPWREEEPLFTGVGEAVAEVAFEDRCR